VARRSAGVGGKARPERRRAATAFRRLTLDPFCAASLSLLDAGALALAADYAAEGRARRVVDFDDHLDDLSRRDSLPQPLCALPRGIAASDGNS